jgi:predicted DNA binding CopG/RHH family protein
MKKPSLKNLKVDKVETKRISAAMVRQKSIKITINIDAQTLIKLRTMADESGVPYQRLINKTLSESLSDRKAAESRLERIENEIRTLKRKLAA